MKLKSLLDEFSHGGMSDRAPMTEEESRMFMSITMMDMQGIPPEAEKLTKEAPICLIIDSRLEMAGVRTTVAVLLWMDIVCDGNPGNAVMWAYTLCHIAEKRGHNTVTWDDLIMSFPNGFPVERTLRQCWEAQKQRPDSKKGIPDNKMDMRASWELGVECEVVS